MKTAALIAIAGLASVASAQSVTVNLTHDDADNNILIGESVTWTLTVEFTGAAAASGGNMSITGANGTSTAMTYQPTNGGNNGGDSNGAGITFVSWTNSVLIGQFDPTKPHNPDNPLTVGSFGWTGDSVGDAGLTFGIGLAASAFVSIDVNAFSTLDFAQNEANINVQALSVSEIPSPASAALLGLGGLVATRRRR